MLSVFFVLLITFASINIANYVVIENNAKDALTQIIIQGTEEQPLGGGPQNGAHGIELRQEHYFVVSINQDGTVNKTNNRQMFILSETECQDLALKVYQKELTGGKYNDFRYKMALKDDGLTYVGFIDIKERLDNFNNFLMISSLVALGAFLAMGGLIILGSKIVFKSSEEAYKNQKRFITNASHELKTPLTIISADVDLIEMDHGKSEWSESIKDQVDRLTKMTNELVTLSKFQEEDNTKFPFEDFSLNEVCFKAVESFSPRFKHEGIKFSSNITGNLTMFGNKHAIEELIYVFLDNSVKYTGGDNKSSYFVVNKNSKNKIEFRFSNTIDKDNETDTTQMLDRFYRSPSSKKGGSGIGLSIASEIIKLHKGKIKIDKNDTTIAFIIVFE